MKHHGARPQLDVLLLFSNKHGVNKVVKGVS